MLGAISNLLQLKLTALCRTQQGVAMIRCLGFGIACLATIGCAPGPPDVYAVPIDAAYQKLKSGDLDDFRDARQCGILIHIATQGTLNE